MHSWLSRTARIGCEQKLYMSSSTRKPRTACWRGLHERHGRGRETHLHDYTRPAAYFGDELGGLSTLLGLFASPPLILSTESVVVMVWKGMSTSTATSTEVYRRCNQRAHTLPHHDHDRFGREYQWGTCKEPQRGAQSAQFIAEICSWPRVVVEMRLTSSS